MSNYLFVMVALSATLPQSSLGLMSQYLFREINMDEMSTPDSLQGESRQMVSPMNSGLQST